MIHVAYYEELTADPVGTLERIEQWSSYDLSRAREKLRASEFFQVGHIVTGNRLRKQGRAASTRRQGPAGRTGSSPA